MNFKQIAVFVSLAIGVNATTVTLQQGVAGYQGCEDVTLFSDSKAENYSWYNNSQYYGAPTDENLIATQFCC